MTDYNDKNANILDKIKQNNITQLDKITSIRQNNLKR